MKLRIGTRGSPLALRQTEMVRAALLEKHSGMDVEILPIRTLGDQWGDRRLSQWGGKGLFTREIEEALLAKRIDLAVHSCKDLPSEIPERLCLAAFPKREDPRDIFIPRGAEKFRALPQRARIGTGSLRRQIQLLAQRPDFEIRPLRGNVDTRIRKLESEGLDGIVLAIAGLRRLGKSLEFFEYLPTDEMIPAVGQGALAIQCRREDRLTREKVAELNDLPTEVAIRAERAALERLGGNCNVPMAFHSWIEGETLKMIGMVGSLNGERVVKGGLEGSISEPEEIGLKLTQQMLAQGAGKILKEYEGASI